MSTKGKNKLEGSGQEVIPPASITSSATKKEYIVTKLMTRRAEGMKVYEVDSTIMLTDAEAAPLLADGRFIRLKKVQPRKRATKKKE